jgi:hypothetical protein
MWPPKRWEIESGHIRIPSWVQGERRRRRRRCKHAEEFVLLIMHIRNKIVIKIINKYE